MQGEEPFDSYKGYCAGLRAAPDRNLLHADVSIVLHTRRGRRIQEGETWLVNSGDEDAEADDMDDDEDAEADARGGGECVIV